MSKDEWVTEVGRAFARSMPDEFPEGFAYFLAESRATKGAYDAYISGDFAPGNLYEPRPDWDE